MVLVSVIMPSFNHQKYISEAIESVLNQSFTDFELIIIDDCSKDNSRRIIENYRKMDGRIRTIFHNWNMGIAKSLNDGINEAKGRYIAFMNSDDVWMNSKLEKQLAILENNEDLIVWSEGKIIDSNGVLTGETFTQKHFALEKKKNGDIFEELLNGNLIFFASSILRRGNVGNIRFDKQLKYLNDYRFWLEFAKKYKFYFMQEPLAKYRIHGRNAILKDWRGWQHDDALVCEYILKEYGKEISTEAEREILFRMGLAYLRLGQKAEARYIIFRAISLNLLLQTTLLYFVIALAGEESRVGRSLIDLYYLTQWLLAGLLRRRGSGKLWWWREGYESTRQRRQEYSVAYDREYEIKRAQDKLLKEKYDLNTRKLIVFLTPGFDGVTGGILSIASIYEETKKLKSMHEAETILCTIPGQPLLLRYTKFQNQNYIYSFSPVLSYFQNLQSLMIHIPEYCLEQFLHSISYDDFLRINKVEDVHVNIMLQNIELLSPMEYVERLKDFGKLTCTTAHEKYSTLELRKKLGFPLHKLSVYVSSEKYHKKKYNEKENLMIVSHDTHPKKSEILNLIAGHFPQLKIQVINNMIYEKYKKVISKAKWALTFGEGLDNYFLETIFSGGVSFSVYDSKFFTEDFKSLRTVYDNYDVLIKKICLDIMDLDNEIAYTDYQKKQYDLCSSHYKYEEYIKNLEAFYRGDYTYK